MRTPRGHIALAVVLCLGLIAGTSACGAEHETEVVEGEPLALGDLRINVHLTRFLNPRDRGDAEYLIGEEVPPPPGRDYLGVFLSIDNDSDDPVELPSADEIRVFDSIGTEYEPIPTDSIFALPLGEDVPGDSRIPEANTASASGPIQGSVVLFLVDVGISENRPLELELEADGEHGVVELDI